MLTRGCHQGCFVANSNLMLCVLMKGFIQYMTQVCVVCLFLKGLFIVVQINWLNHWKSIVLENHCSIFFEVFYASSMLLLRFFYVSSLRLLCFFYASSTLLLCFFYASPMLQVSAVTARKLITFRRIVLNLIKCQKLPQMCKQGRKY